MAKARKLPSGSWYCQAERYIDGKRIRKGFTGETKAEAEMLAASWKVQQDEREKKTITLESAMEDYIESCRCSGMSPSTIKGYTTAKKNGFKDLLGSDIFKLSTPQIQLVVNDLSKSLSPKTIRNYVGFLSVVLRQYDDIKVNTDKLKLPKKQTHEMEIPTTEQIKKMLNATQKDDDLYCAILLASMLGLRLSEACALTWSKIKTIKGKRYAVIDSALVPDENNTYHLKDPKTEAGNRQLPIPEAVWKLLSKHRNLNDRIINCKPSSITYKYAKLTEHLNVPGRFHDLRHYHASVMLSLGVPEKYICADMGHSTFDMVKRVYGHTMKDKQEEINSQMEEQASKIL